MDGSLVELAQRFVPVGETGLNPRRHEAAADERSRGRKRTPYAGQTTPEGASGAASRRDDPQAPAVVAGDANGGDRQAGGDAKVDDGRAAEAPSGEGPDRARRCQRRVASAGLTAEEIADLLAPGSASPCERWVKPLTRREATSSARFGASMVHEAVSIGYSSVVNICPPAGQACQATDAPIGRGCRRCRRSVRSAKPRGGKR